jgi:hypothetical protein
VPTITGIEPGAGFFDFSSEQAEENKVKRSNPKILLKTLVKRD